MARLSRRFRFLTFGHWPGPRSLAATNGVSVDVLSSGYLDVSVRRVCFLHLCIQCRMTLAGRVSPFGNPRIKACSQLPVAFRSVLRPSSPLSAKASTKCPFALDCRVVAYRGKPRQRYVSDFISNILAPQNSLYANREGRCFEYFVGSGLQPIHDVQQRNRTNDKHVAGAKPAFRSSDLEKGGRSSNSAGIPRLVELDGIEPTTSCLQSRRSPN